MEVIPAIDLKDGACVRLYQGDFEKTTVFSTDPAETALRWQSAGAPRIHVVDLDGSRSGIPANLESIRAIADAVSVPLQVGGGVRTVETAQALLEAGVERVVLGTAAVEDPAIGAGAMPPLGAGAGGGGRGRPEGTGGHPRLDGGHAR